MAYLSGTQGKLAYKIQSAFGSVATVGSGNRVRFDGLEDDDGISREGNLEEISADITEMDESNGQAKLKVSMPSVYHGMPDVLIAQALGDVGGVTVTPKSLGAARHRHYKEKRPTPDDAATAVWSLNTSVEVREAVDCMASVLKFDWPEDAPGSLSADLLTGTHTSSGTNGQTELDAATFPHSCSQCGISRRKHIALQLWRKGGTAAYVQAKSLALEIVAALSEDNMATQSSTGATYTQPQASGKRPHKLTIELPSITSNDWGESWDNDVIYRGIISSTDTRGSNGVSKSGLNPLLTTAGGAGSIGFTPINGEAAQQISIPATWTDGAAIAAGLQAAIRALTATNPAYQTAYSECTVTYTGTPVTDYYTCTPGGHFGDISKPLFSAGATGVDYSVTMKLGAANGGTEQTGVYNALHFFLPELHLAKNPGTRTIDSIGRKQTSMEFIVSGCWVQAGESLPAEFTAAGSAILEYNVTTPIECVVINERSSDML